MAVGNGVTVGRGVCVGMAVGLMVGVHVGIAVGCGVFVGTAVGKVVGLGVFVGADVGTIVGVRVGVAVGVIVGMAVAVFVGVTVGCGVGVFSGVIQIGWGVGVAVGFGVAVGRFVGFGVAVNVGVMVETAALVGRTVTIGCVTVGENVTVRVGVTILVGVNVGDGVIVFVGEAIGVGVGITIFITPLLVNGENALSFESTSLLLRNCTAWVPNGASEAISIVIVTSTPLPENVSVADSPRMTIVFSDLLKNSRANWVDNKPPINTFFTIIPSEKVMPIAKPAHGSSKLDNQTAKETVSPGWTVILSSKSHAGDGVVVGVGVIVIVGVTDGVIVFVGVSVTVACAIGVASGVIMTIVWAIVGINVGFKTISSGAVISNIVTVGVGESATSKGISPAASLGEGESVKRSCESGEAIGANFLPIGVIDGVGKTADAAAWRSICMRVNDGCFSCCGVNISCSLTLINKVNRSRVSLRSPRKIIVPAFRLPIRAPS